MRSVTILSTRLALIEVPARPSSNQPLFDQTPSKLTLRPPIEKEVYVTFLSTRVGSNTAAGEAEHDWYYNATRVLIHRLLRNQSTRGRRRVVVLSIAGKLNGRC
jgi:alpha-N-acetylglucosamine transferase